MLESPFNRLARFKTCNFLKKRLQHECFPVSIAKFLRTLILIKIREQLLLPFLLLTVNISSQGLLQQAFFEGSLQGLKSSPQGAQWQAPLLFEKKKISRNSHSLSLVVTCSTRCLWLYHLLSFVVTRCHSSSLDVPLDRLNSHLITFFFLLNVYEIIKRKKNKT